ncbi:MAG: TonB-dependent receptor [Flavobacteriales bacterium]|nr:TonB-dependent receptor [Flavobacteriales bacterium]
MKKIILVLIILVKIILVPVYGQNDSDKVEKTVSLDEIVISANKAEEHKRKISAQIIRINSRQIQFGNNQTTADLISGTGHVMVQKSQQGGGSPVMRGFEASRMLLVIDGVRLNNLIYRSGHLQNVITIDPSILENVELLFGPGSTVYGSDALGGTIHFITKKPVLKTAGNNGYKLNFLQRYSTVNKGSTTHLNVNVGGKKLASLTSITYNSFGDLRMGKSKNPFFDSLYGLREIYAQRIDGTDTRVVNSDKYLQKGSAYKQSDFLQKLLYKPSKYVEHQLNFQYSSSSNIDRYDRLSEVVNDLPRYSEWYYGPQNRTLTAYDLNVKNVSGFEQFHFGVNHQNIEESRVTRRFGNNNLDSRIEKVNVVGINLDLKKKIKNTDLKFGYDGQLNYLNSTANRKNIADGSESELDTRYPDGDNSLHHHAIYLTQSTELSKKWILNNGIRYGRSVLNSNIINNSFYDLPVTEIKQKNYTYSGYLGIIYFPKKDIKLSYMINSGFRVPNTDDLSKIFETSKGVVIIPNSNLKPEQTLTNEFTLSLKPTKAFRIEGTVWYTSFFNAITTGPSTLNGSDSILYDGEMSKIFSNNNSGRAQLYGYNVSIAGYLSEYSQLYANLAYTRGEVVSADPNTPLDHISPIIANAGYLLKYKKLTSEFNLQFNGKKDIELYSSSGEDNQKYAPPGGMPAWLTLNLKLSYELPKNLILQGGVDNVLDTHYRVFASGIHAPGRNIFLAVRFSM